MLKGTIEDIGLSHILSMLSAANKTGRLHVERRSGKGQVFLRDGDPYFAQSSLCRAVIGQKLVESGAITEKQLRYALDQQAETGDRLGDILLSTGVVTPSQVEAAVVAQIKDALLDLLDWEIGEFNWEPGIEFELEINIAPSTDKTAEYRGKSNLVAAGAVSEPPAEVDPPSNDAIVVLSPMSPDRVDFFDITTEQWRIASLANGRRTVGEIVTAAGPEVDANFRLVHNMLTEGILEVVEDPFRLEHFSGETLEAAQGSEAGEPEPFFEGGEPVFESPESVIDDGEPSFEGSSTQEGSDDEVPAFEDEPSGPIDVSTSTEPEAAAAPPPPVPPQPVAKEGGESMRLDRSILARELAGLLRPDHRSQH